MAYSEITDRFINVYNELSEYMEEQLHLKEYRSHVQMLNVMSKKNQIIKNNYDELRTFANLRNVIIHDSTSRFNPIAEPRKEVVERYEYILNRLQNPTTAYDIATKAEELVFAHLNMRLIDCIKIMHDKNYSYIPVVEKQKFAGVLSGDSIFTYMRKNYIVTIYEDFRVGDLGDSIKEHMDERYGFVSKATLADDIIYMYNNDIKDGRRLGALFVTDNGREEEKIVGMISAWDLIEHIGKDEK